MLGNMPKSLLENLKEGGSIFFGEAWRYKSTEGILLPILVRAYLPRAYITLEGALAKNKESVLLKDSGSINRLLLETKEDSSVFIRAGTMLEGKGTQSRTIQTSRVIMPTNETVEVPIRCVHLSSSIRAGKDFTVSEEVSTPREVMSRVYSGDQSGIWECTGSLSVYATNLAMSLHSSYSGGNSLIEASKTIQALHANVDEMILSAPCLEKQVGVMVLRPNEVLGIEFFDNPESWKEVYKATIKKYSLDLTKSLDEEVFKVELDREVILKKASEFLSTVIASEENETYKDERSQGYLFTGEKVIGEYTVLDGRLIHLSAITAEKIPPKSSRISGGVPLVLNFSNTGNGLV